MKREFGDLENEIVMILKTKKRMTVNDVLEALGNSDKYTTVMTVMTRLVNKGILARQRTGLRFEYWLEDSQTKQQSILKKVCAKLFNMKTTEVVSYLIQTKDLSDNDLQEMEKMIAEAKKKKEKQVV
jgi:predicted transcriptional regulator